MCRPKPFPRCADHARKALVAAQASGDTKAEEKAQLAFDMTPTGVNALRASDNIADHIKADICEQLYLKQVKKAEKTIARREKEKVKAEQSLLDFATKVRTMMWSSNDREDEYDEEMNGYASEQSDWDRAWEEVSGHIAYEDNPRAIELIYNSLDNLEGKDILDRDQYTDDILKHMGENIHTPPHLLTKLAKDDRRDVKEAVASNPNTPVATLEGLSKSNEWGVSRGLLENRSTPIAALIKLRNQGEQLPHAQRERITAEVEAHRKQEGLEGIPDSYIEKMLWG